MQIYATEVGFEIPFGLEIAFSIIAIVAIFVIAFLIGKHREKYTFKCTGCGHLFHKKWWQLIFSEVHYFSNEHWALKCPKCKCDRAVRSETEIN